LETFRNLCAWGLIWAFFVMAPAQLIGLAIKETKEPYDKIKVHLDVARYCEAAVYDTNEQIISCIIRLGKRAGLGMDVYELRINILGLDAVLEEDLGMPWEEYVKKFKKNK